MRLTMMTNDNNMNDEAAPHTLTRHDDNVDVDVDADDADVDADDDDDNDVTGGAAWDAGQQLVSNVGGEQRRGVRRCRTFIATASIC